MTNDLAKIDNNLRNENGNNFMKKSNKINLISTKVNFEKSKSIWVWNLVTDKLYFLVIMNLNERL